MLNSRTVFFKNEDHITNVWSEEWQVFVFFIYSQLKIKNLDSVRDWGNSKWGTLYTSIFIQFYTVWWSIIDPWRCYFFTQVSPNIRDITVLLVHLLEKGCCVKPCGTFYFCLFWLLILNQTFNRYSTNEAKHIKTTSSLNTIILLETLRFTFYHWWFLSEWGSVILNMV